MTSPFSKDYKSQLGDFLKQANQNTQKSKRATKVVRALRKDNPDACKIRIQNKGTKK